MCKAGILALGADLYFSAFRQFEGLIRILQHQQTMQLGSSTGIPRILMDLTAHFVALMTLILTFRGRVNRQTAGRVVLPVLVVKFMLEVEVLQRQHKVHDGGETQIMLSRNDTLMFLKSVLFLTIIVKVAFFDKDTTCIACDEWLPMRGNGNKSDALSTTEFYVHEEEKSSQPVESGNDDKKVKKKKHRDKERK